MSHELLTDYDQAEKSLNRTLEQYRASPVSTLETYAYYGLDKADEAGAEKRAQQKKQFLEGEIRNPRLNYPLLETSAAVKEIAGMEKQVLDLMYASTELAHDPDREEALYDILRVRRLEIGMLEISRALTSGELVGTQKTILVEAFNMANDEAHGKLDRARFNGLVRQIQETAANLLGGGNTPDDVKEAANFYLGNTQDVRGEEAVMPLEIDPAHTKKLGEFIRGEFEDILLCVPDKPEDKKFTIDEVVEVFRAAHAIKQTDWSVRTEEGATSIDTRQSKKATVIGTKRKLPTKLELEGVLIHENGVHVQRRQRGDALGDPLLGGTGLAWYLDAEEGICSILEQSINGKETEPGVQYYMTIGLARGLDGHQPRDFRAVYELEWRRRLMSEFENKGIVEEERIEKLKDLSYNVCVRIFRGTSCDIPGMVYTKDQAYFSGTQKMRELIMDIINLPEEGRYKAFDRLFVAKYDPTNAKHDQLVERALSNIE